MPYVGCHYAECLHAECRVLFFVIMSADMLNIVMLRVVMLSVEQCDQIGRNSDILATLGHCLHSKISNTQAVPTHSLL